MIDSTRSAVRKESQAERPKPTVPGTPSARRPRWAPPNGPRAGDCRELPHVTPQSGGATLYATPVVRARPLHYTCVGLGWPRPQISWTSLPTRRLLHPERAPLRLGGRVRRGLGDRGPHAVGAPPGGLVLPDVGARGADRALHALDRDPVSYTHLTLPKKRK